MFISAILVGMSLTMILFPIAVTAAAILLEMHFIRKRKKGEWILPIIVTVLAIALIVPNAKEGSGGGYGTSWVVVDGTDAEFSMVIDVNKEVAAISYLMVGEGENARYIPLEFEEGRLIGSQEAMKAKKDIEKAMASYQKGFTGRSLPADQIRDMQVQVREEHFTWNAFFLMCIFFAPGPVSLWIVYLISILRRRRRNRLEKVKLQDLT